MEQLVERKGWRDLGTTERDYRGFVQPQELERRVRDGIASTFLIEGLHPKQELDAVVQKVTLIFCLS